MRGRSTVIAAAIVTAALGAVRGDDPRPAADAPFEATAPGEPRMSRRAQRRASRRRTAPPDAVPPPAPPIEVTTTLSSPFEEMGATARESFVLHRDQPYADACRERQQFDLYLPKGCGGALPLVVWIHGETWQSGSRADCPVTWLVDRGYAVASVGYRPSSMAPFPAQLDDCLAALLAIEQDADLWGIDRDRICVAGSAAGGHLAALAGLWDQPAVERPLPHVAAVCAINAPTHLTTLGPEHDRAASPASRLVGGPLPEFREAAQQASPLTHVSADDPPVLVLHARTGAPVPFEQSQKFTTALRAAGVRATLIAIEPPAAATSLDRDSPVGRALVEFLDGTLGPGSRPDTSLTAP